MALSMAYHQSGGKKLIQRVSLREKHDTLIKDIGVGKQQLVEIAKALSKSVELLILDEPTAALNDEDSNNLLNLLLELNQKQGLTCIIISHKIHEVTRIADEITVIRDGALIETLVKGRDDISENRLLRVWWVESLLIGSRKELPKLVT